MTRKETILEDNVHIVRGYVKRLLPATNGLALPKYLEAAKKEYLNFSTTHLVDDLITVEQEYPVGGLLPVTLHSDMIVMNRAHFAELLDILETEVKLATINVIKEPISHN